MLFDVFPLAQQLPMEKFLCILAFGHSFLPFFQVRAQMTTNSLGSFSTSLRCRVIDLFFLSLSVESCISGKSMSLFVIVKVGRLDRRGSSFWVAQLLS